MKRLSREVLVPATHINRITKIEPTDKSGMYATMKTLGGELRAALGQPERLKQIAGGADGKVWHTDCAPGDLDGVMAFARVSFMNEDMKALRQTVTELGKVFWCSVRVLVSFSSGVGSVRKSGFFGHQAFA